MPRELAEKWKPAYNLPRCPYEVLRTDKFENSVISEMQIATFAESTITEKDREILKLRMEGYTEQEIADKVGYKTASAVHKRIAKIANAYEDYVTAEYQKYLDK